MLSLSTTSISTTLEYPASNLATLEGLKALLRVWASSRMWGRTAIACAPQGFLVALPDIVSTENPPLTICSGSVGAAARLVTANKVFTSIVNSALLGVGEKLIRYDDQAF